MRVFKKRAAFPEFDRQREHVVTVARRPVGHGHPGFVAGHETTEADEQKSGERRQHGEPEQPRIGFHLRVCVHTKKLPPRFFKRSGSPNLNYFTSKAGKFTVTLLSLTSIS